PGKGAILLMRSREPSLLPVPAEAYWPYPGYARPMLGGPSAPDGMEFFRKLWRCKLLILAAGLGGGILAAAINATMEPRYAAESQLLIGVETPKISDIPAVLQGVSPDQEVMQSESFVLQSRGLASQ